MERLTDKELLELFAGDPSPVDIAEKVIGGGERWSTQRAILQSVWDNPRTLVASGHGLGKTFTAADVVIAFMLAFSPAKVITSAPTWRQVKNLLWSEINTKYKNAPRPLGGRMLDTRWDFRDDWFAEGFSPEVGADHDRDRGTKAAGYHSPNILVVIDEAPGVDPMLMEAVDGLLTGAHARYLGIGNPVSSSGPFYNDWTSGRVTKIHMSCFDSPNFVANKVTTLEHLEKLAQTKDEAELMSLAAPCPALTTVAWAAMMLKKWGAGSVVFKSRALGTFPDQANDTLVPLSWLEKCKLLDLPGRKHMMQGKSLGVDVARFGKDMTCFQGFDGWKHVLREVQSGWDTQRTAGRVIQLLRDEDYRVVAIDVDGLGCFDDQTDILTDNGWMRFADLSGIERVLTMNPRTRKTEYRQPTHRQAYEYEGPMHKLERATANFCVTPNHNMFMHGVNEADWKIQRADQIKINEIELARMVRWSGREVAEYHLPHTVFSRPHLKRGSNGGAWGRVATAADYSMKDKVCPGKTIRMDDWLCLLGWILSEGYTYRKRNSGSYYVGITQKNPAKETLIAEAITAAGFEYYLKRHKSGEVVFLIGSKQLYEEVRRYGASATSKVPPRYITDLSARQIRIFLNSFLLGDGTIHNGNPMYYTSSKGMADVLHELVLKAGSAASLIVRHQKGSQAQIEGRTITRTADGYAVCEYRRDCATHVRWRNVSLVPYRGMVYCVTVPPHHLIYVRRGGRCMWSGNSGVYDAVCAWNRGQGGKRYVILPVHNGAKPENTEQFLNVRAESYWNARELIKDAKVEVKDEGDLFHQLTAIKYRVNSKGQIELETKEQMSRRGLQSPDEADAFVLGLMAARVNSPGSSSATGWVERMASEGADRDTASAPWRR